MRTTRRRTALMDLLKSSDRFQSAQELHTALARHGEPLALSTVYRALQHFVDSEDVHIFRAADGEALYRRCNRPDHHGHLISPTAHDRRLHRPGACPSSMRYVGTERPHQSVEAAGITCKASAMRSEHVSRVIRAPAEAVYEFASDVENLPRWAAGLARSTIARDGDLLIVDSPMGPVTVRFVERNSFGVLDHDVTLPSGTVVTNPVRVLPHPHGAEVVFTVRQIELDDAGFSRDIGLVQADLDRLAHLLGDPD